MSIPPTRRLIISHTPTGESEVFEDSPSMMDVVEGLRCAGGYVQKGIPADPVLAKDGMTAMPDGAAHGTQSDGATVAIIDMQPGSKSSTHYTNSFGYHIVTHGQLTITLHDGTVKHAVPGELVITTAAAIQWSNTSKEPLRVMSVILPSKPRLFDGKTMNESMGVKEGGP